MKGVSTLEIGKINHIGILGPNAQVSDFIFLDRCSDGNFRVEKDGVVGILSTKDRKIEFIFFADHALCFINSALGYPAYYPIHKAKIEKKVKAVLMDFDGTSVKSGSVKKISHFCYS